MAKISSDSAIILRRIDYGEADRIITFLTKSAGKVRGMLKGVRRQKSKMAGGIELFSISEIHYIKGRGDIDTVTSTRLIIHYGNIVKDIDRTEAAYQMLKRINEIVEDSHGQEYFVILSEALAGLDDMRINTDIICLNFDMRIMQAYGNLPDFSRDKQGQLLDQDDKFEFDYESVSFYPHTNGKFDKNHIKFLKLLAYNPPQSIMLIDRVTRYIIEVEGIIRAISPV